MFRSQQQEQLLLVLVCGQCIVLWLHHTSYRSEASVNAGIGSYNGICWVTTDSPSYQVISWVHWFGSREFLCLTATKSARSCPWYLAKYSGVHWGRYYDSWGPSFSRATVILLNAAEILRSKNARVACGSLRYLPCQFLSCNVRKKVLNGL